ncbi:MAG: TlpA disulfide reductase family protein [Planctomycetota bacterium]
MTSTTLAPVRSRSLFCRSLRGLLCASLCAPLCTAGLAAVDDPPEWRSRRPNKDPSAAWDAMEGRPAPSLASLTHWLSTSALTWEDMRGHVVLVDLWGTWCPPCVSAVPHLQELAERHAQDGLLVLGVHSKKGLARLATFVEKKGVSYVVAADSENTFKRAMHVKAWPTYYIVDRDGNVRIAGVAKGSDAEGRRWMDKALEAILAEPWEGERREVRIQPPLPEPQPAAQATSKKTEPQGGLATRAETGPDGWPARPVKKLYAKNDFRGRAAPAFVVQSWLTKQPDLKGKVLLVDFWATWCGPCVAGMPHMQELHERFGDDLVVVGLSDQAPEAMGSRGKPWGPVVAEFLAKRPEITYAQALDGQARLKQALGVEGIPHVMIVSSDGIVRWQGFPGDASDPLDAALVARIIERDKQLRSPPQPPQSPQRVRKVRTVRVKRKGGTH